MGPFYTIAPEKSALDILMNLKRLRQWFSKCCFGLGASASLGNILEMQNLSPIPDLLDQEPQGVWSAIFVLSSPSGDVVC